MIHRLLTIPLKQVDFQNELNIIKQIALNNGFIISIINKILKQKMYKKTLEMIFPTKKDQDNRYNVITYIGQTSTKIVNFLKNLNIKTAFKTQNSLGKSLKNNKTKTTKYNKSGVYKLTYENCPKKVYRPNR